MGSQRIPTVGSSVPGVTTRPGSLQTWAHVAGDGQELHPVLVTSGFLLPAPSGKQTAIFFKRRRKSSIHTWCISPFALCLMAVVTGGGCILAGPSLPSALEAEDPPMVGGRKLMPNILTRGTYEQLRQNPSWRGGQCKRSAVPPACVPSGMRPLRFSWHERSKTVAKAASSSQPRGSPNSHHWEAGAVGSCLDWTWAPLIRELILSC